MDNFDLRKYISENREENGDGRMVEPGSYSILDYDTDGTYPTIDFNGEQANPNPKEIQIEIDSIRKQPPPMSDREYREKMMRLSGRY